MGQGRRHEGVGVAPVIAVEIADELEVLHPLVGAEQVEVGGADEIDRNLVSVEEAAHVGKPVKLAPAPDTRRLGGGLRGGHECPLAGPLGSYRFEHYEAGA